MAGQGPHSTYTAAFAIQCAAPRVSNLSYRGPSQYSTPRRIQNRVVNGVRKTCKTTRHDLRVRLHHKNSPAAGAANPAAAAAIADDVDDNAAYKVAVFVRHSHSQ